MRSHPPARTPARKPPKDRRAAAGALGPVQLLRRLTGLLRRPLGLQRRDGQWRLVFVERRRARPADDAHALQRLHADLHATLLHYAPDDAARLMRQLVQVHDALLRRGWAGVLALPAAVRSKALFQAELLAREEPTPALLTVIARLHLQQAPPAADAAPATAPRSHADGPEDGMPVEVSELSQEEFRATQHSWFGSLPPASDAAAAPDAVR